MSGTAGGDAENAHAIIRQRFEEAGVAAGRFVEVADGEKACYNHDTRYDDPAAVPGQNYGVYSDESGTFVTLDVDDHKNIDDRAGLLALHALPPTLEVESAHGGTHKYYNVDLDDVEAATAGEFLKQEVTPASSDSKNPEPSWGEVQAHNCFVVGAGSQLDGCNKEWCDECATAEGGRYTIHHDQAIETVAAADLAEVLRADPEFGANDGQAAAGDVEDVEGRPRGGSDGGGGDGGEEYEEWIDEATAREMLAEIDPDIDYDEGWRDIGLALGELFDDETQEELFTEWSEEGKKWDGNTYDILDARAHAVTPATLVHLAKKHGWQKSTMARRRTDEGGRGRSLTLSPQAVEVEAGLGEEETLADLDDRQKAAAVWGIIRQHDEVHVRCRRDNGALWAYDAETGTWDAGGERALRHAASKALPRAHYGSNVLAELKAQAKADFEVEVEADEWGVSSGTVAVDNGLLDLNYAAANAGDDALRPLRPEDYALARLPVEYDPDAEADEWRDLVEEWVEDGYADALQEFVGYCLHVGEMPIHRALLLVGSGSNGKGTFLHVVRQLLGTDNTASTELQTLANERDAVADMEGALANIDDDLSSRGLGSGLGMFKKLVAGDPVRARQLYEDGYEFTPSTKHLYAANQVPDVKVSDDDEAFWRRWLLVEFPNHYAPEERDTSLRDRLTADGALAGVLNWAIEGRRRLLNQGYFTGERTMAYEKRRRWQEWGDTVDEFIEACVEYDEAAGRISTADAYTIYRVWCEANGKDPVGQRQVTNALKTEGLGYGRHRIDGSAGVRGYTALGFTETAPEPEAVLNDGQSDDAQAQLVDEGAAGGEGAATDGGAQADTSTAEGDVLKDEEAAAGDVEDVEGEVAGDLNDGGGNEEDGDGGGTGWGWALAALTGDVEIEGGAPQVGDPLVPADLAERTGKGAKYWELGLEELASEVGAVERDGDGGYRRGGG